MKPQPPGAAPADLTDRLILALVNECVACLREGVVEDADLVDAAVIFGTGFAPFRGGPLTYARARGADTGRVRLAELAQRYGARFAPDAGWALLAPVYARESRRARTARRPVLPSNTPRHVPTNQNG